MPGCPRLVILQQRPWMFPTRPVAASQVSVEGAEQRGRGRQQHMVYVLAVEAAVAANPGQPPAQLGAPRSCWRVERRWSDFQALRSALAAAAAPSKLPPSWTALSRARSLVRTTRCDGHLRPAACVSLC